MEGERLISELHKASNNSQQWQQLQEELFNSACEKEKHHVKWHITDYKSNAITSQIAYEA
jgi:hypothetical protein